MKRPGSIVGLTLVAGIAGAVWLGGRVVAGDLNPPSGPVQPTMRTLDEVFAAAGAGGAGGGCGEGIPGADRGSCQIVSSNLSPFNSTAYEVGVELTRAVSQQGGSTGALLAGPTRFRKDQDQNSPLIVQRIAVNSALQSMRIVYRDGAGTPYYEIAFTDVRFVGFTPEAKQRCDGSYAHTEVVEFIWAMATFTDVATGADYTVNLSSPAVAEE